ncbi:stage IV sporulation protein B [Sedimentisphaera cyanobacteriorum]|uniref:Stage IV sporulation protein B n=1 Tax=Sedimentisphaera cyanobacteriorum TaxID=1940790 RepID=A0A1Q2HP48_9BACT|nr:SpoIVB peptidase S55 domain-containing protein [Sedimentisphaera cyanobacteriorum]AQQ09054.1 stage IV sporulation protein B [Sedimentisphaera cyanobacteriorum]
MQRKNFLFIALSASLLLAAGSFCKGSDIDTSKYMPLKEVKAGMEGYALSVYKGTEIEKFPIRVVSVMEDYRPGQDAFLIMGTGKKFKHTGPVAGCSGSPVVIEGRIAGALAFGWSFPKDPLYGVTPIEEMLAIDKRKKQLKIIESPSSIASLTDDKLNYKAICGKINAKASSMLGGEGSLICSSFRPNTISGLEGLSADNMLYNAAGASSTSNALPNFEPGSVICVPLVDGDIKMSVVGTLTAVEDDKIFAFGHPFTGEGRVELPFSAGVVHTVVASQQRSMKLASSTIPVGTLTADEETGIYGEIGKKPPQIKMTSKIFSYDTPKTKVYECLLADHQIFSPMLAQSIITSTAAKNSEPPEFHSVYYKAVLNVEGIDDIVIDNISSGSGMRTAAYEVGGILGLLQSNEFHRPKIHSIDFTSRIENKNIQAKITSAEVSDLEIQPGDNVNIDLMLEKEFEKEKRAQISLKIPEDTSPGEKEILISGTTQYKAFVNKMEPDRPLYDDFDSMISAIRKDMSFGKRIGLYAYMKTQRSGISYGKFNMANLPDSRAAVIANPKRNYKVQPVYDWISSKLDVPYIINNSIKVKIEILNKSEK